MKFALPVVFNMVISIIYNVADTFFIAQTNNLNLVAGVSLGSPIFMILMAFGNILGQGGSSLIARLIGQKDTEKVKRVSSFCFYCALLMGAAAGIIMIIFQKSFLILLGASSQTYEYARQYYIVLAAGAPLIVLSFIHSNLIRSEGMASESMIGSISGTLVNIVLDPLFISVFGLGAGGAAIATVAGYTVTDVLLSVIVVKKSHYMTISPEYCMIEKAHFTQIFGIGIPAALTNIMSSICTILTNQHLLAYGDDKIAAMGIVLKVSMIGTLVLTGFSFGGAPIIGYFYGARNKQKLEELFRFCFRFIIAAGTVLGAVLFLSTPYLLKMFISDAALMQEASIMFKLQVVCLPFAAVVLMSTIFCQSFGKMSGSFVLSLSRQGFIFIAVIYVMAALFGYNGVISTQLTADLVSMIIALAVILKIIRPAINNIEIQNIQ